MDFLEKDLEDIIFNSPQGLLRERGLFCFYHHHIFRQVNIGAYGIADLVSMWRSRDYINIRIYELKNKILNPESFWQLTRYMKGIKHALYDLNLKNKRIDVNGVLLGREIDMNSNFCFLPTIQSKISIFTYNYNYDGIKFEVLDDSYIKTGFTTMDIKQFYSYSKFSLYRNFFIEELSEVIENKDHTNA